MKKILLFVITFLIMITGTKALEFDLYSNNAILYNYDLDEVLYEKDADEVISVASMTKIMTAIVLLENTDNLDTKVVLTNKHFAGLKELGVSVAGFYQGQKVTYRDLFYGIMLPSGADAVQALAIEIFGSNDKLVKKMNEKASELDLKNTHFVNPYGLDHKEHYSTVREISIILKYALKNEMFKQMYTTRKYLTSDTNLTLYSTLVEPLKTIGNSVDYIKGSKTGFTYGAGRCLSSLAYDSEDEVNYLLVTAGTPNIRHYPVLDAINIYQTAFNEYANKIILKNNEVVTKVKTKYAKEKEVNLIIKEDIKLFIEEKNFDENKISYTYKTPDKITKILKSDEKVGSLTISYDGSEIKTSDLFLESDMHFSIFRFILNIILPIGFIAVICIFIFKKKK